MAESTRLLTLGGEGAIAASIHYSEFSCCIPPKYKASHQAPTVCVRTPPSDSYMNIRIANEADLPELSNLFRQTISVHGLQYYTTHQTEVWAAFGGDV